MIIKEFPTKIIVGSTFSYQCIALYRINELISMGGGPLDGLDILVNNHAAFAIGLSSHDGSHVFFKLRISSRSVGILTLAVYIVFFRLSPAIY